MRRKILLCGWLALFSLSSTSCGGSRAEQVAIATSFGTIVIAVDSARAPITSANFLRYVDERQFDGGSFYRTVTAANTQGSSVKIDVIQGGLADTSRAHPPIALETTQTTGITHKAGTLSMARDTRDESAMGEFFICVTDAPALDFKGEGTRGGNGYAAFGRVVSGMEVVRKIHQSRAEGQKLVPPVRIESVRRSAHSDGIATPG
jgi:peptidyl-prolyl cis-trans isomerase A (cyclophilin A)